MSDLTARAIADLKAELAESKAAANRVTESMGSEIMRLTAQLEAARAEALRVGKDFCATAAELSTTRTELEQQRTRAEAAEQELRAERERVNSGEWVEKAHAETLDRACKELEAELAASEQELRMVSEAFKRHMAEGRSKPEVRVAEANALSALFDDVAARNKLAAIRAHLAGVEAIGDRTVTYRGDTGFVRFTVTEACGLLAAAREALEP